MPNSIPQSNALTETDPNSLSELFSRDPENYTRQDLDRIISEYRQRRINWDIAEKAGVRVKPVKIEGGNAKSKSLTSDKSVDDLGL